ncbi:MAG: SAM-dependent methyltransferase, partial [Gammaproteobacteria bacterium]|nr:SAM-dependent methyltransferase [Gammaproteobacteria bacterium]
AEALVHQYAREEPEILQQDFYNSLLAAFSPAEVNQQLHDSGLGYLTIEILSDRHLCIFGLTNPHLFSA